MDLIEIAAEVGRQKHELETLKRDESIDTASLHKCDAALDGIRDYVTDLMGAWIPSTLPDLRGAIARVTDNIHEAEQDIAYAINVADPSKPDHVLRIEIACVAIMTLDHMLDQLLEGWQRVTKPPETVN